MAMQRWRPFTWVIVLVNVLFLILIIAAAAGTSDDDCPAPLGSKCPGLGVAILLSLLAILDLFLGAIWLVTRPVRPCPICGHEVRRRQFVCRSCGYDFRTQAQQMPPDAPVPR